LKNLDTYLLLKGLKDGDLHSLEKLYKLYYSKLYWFAKRFNSATLQPDDFVQQTFLKVWEKRSKLKEDILFDKQIYTICRNLIINHLKRESKSVSQVEEGIFLEEEEMDDVEEKNIKLVRLYAMIDKLPPKRKKIFILHKIENLTYEEIALALAISKKTIANHLYLAHNFIKEEIKNNNFFI
tara:strand:- start:446 stop:991 length:546 start_codon:yes stop_codon:yes gene_type:complete